MNLKVSKRLNVISLPSLLLFSAGISTCGAYKGERRPNGQIQTIHPGV